MSAPRLLSATLAAVVLLAGRPAAASFHLMQIEQVIAGVDGSTATQAIQLRMRAAGQQFVSQGHVWVADAAGENPVELLALPGNVATGTTGARVLLATSGFAAATNPGVTPDFTLANPIPDTYMAAGTMTFEDDFGTVYWRVSWGGAAYTGPTTGAITNDVNGDFGPAFAGPLPTASGQALRFQFAANAGSTANSTDYAVTAGPAVFTNNATASGTIVSLVSVPGGPATGVALAGPIPNPAAGPLTYFVTLPRETHVSVDVYDLAGRRRLALVDRRLPAGRNSLTWDPHAAGAAAPGRGIYFLALRAEGVRRTARVVLLGPGTPLREPHDE